jgi:hypothetical protein
MTTRHGEQAATVDDLASICHAPAVREIKMLLNELYPDDFSGVEALTILVGLRSAYQRKQAAAMKPATLTLAKSRTVRRRKKPGTATKD